MKERVNVTANGVDNRPLALLLIVPTWNHLRTEKLSSVEDLSWTMQLTRAAMDLSSLAHPQERAWRLGCGLEVHLNAALLIVPTWNRLGMERLSLVEGVLVTMQHTTVVLDLNLAAHPYEPAWRLKCGLEVHPHALDNVKIQGYQRMVDAL